MSRGGWAKWRGPAFLIGGIVFGLLATIAWLHVPQLPLRPSLTFSPHSQRPGPLGAAAKPAVQRPERQRPGRGPKSVRRCGCVGRPSSNQQARQTLYLESPSPPAPMIYCDSARHGHMRHERHIDSTRAAFVEVLQIFLSPMPFRASRRSRGEWCIHSRTRGKRRTCPRPTTHSSLPRS